MKFRNFIVVLVLMVFIVPGGRAHADVEIGEIGQVLDKFSVGMDVSLFYRADKAPYAGSPVVSGSSKNNANWGEVYSSIRFTAEKDLGWATAVGQLAPAFYQTSGQDGYGLNKDANDIRMAQSWLKLREIKGGPFDVTVGRQDLKLASQLVIGDGEAPYEAAWHNQNSAFDFAVRLDGDFDKLQTTLYWARTKHYAVKFDETFLVGPVDGLEVAGFNGQYNFDDNNFIFAGLHQKIDNDARAIDDNHYLGAGLIAENNTLALDLGGQLALGGFVFEAEGVYQTGDAGSLAGVERDRSAFGGFASGTYHFDVKYAPYLRASYFYFSGDDNPGDDEAGDYDPMFSGFATWNRFIVGEVAAEYHLPVSNKKVSLLEVGFSPAEMVFVSLMYFEHKLDENYWHFVPTSSDDWSQEVNLLIDAPIHKNIYIHTGFGWSKPGDAAIEVLGDDEDSYFVQAQISYHF